MRFSVSLTKLRGAASRLGEANQVRSWALFRLTSRMLLWRTQ